MSHVDLLKTTVGRDWVWAPARVTMLDWQGDETADFGEAVCVRIDQPANSDLRFTMFYPASECQPVRFQ